MWNADMREYKFSVKYRVLMEETGDYHLAEDYTVQYGKHLPMFHS